MIKKRIPWNKGKGGYKRTPFSAEHKKKMSLASKGKPKSEEHKERISNTLKQKYKNKEIKNGFLGKHHTEEIRKKISENNRTRFNPYLSEEAKKKMSKPKPPGYWDKWKLKREGHIVSPETRLKMSVSRIKRLKENNTSYRNTKPELEAENILQKYSIDYKKQFRINYLNTVKLYDFFLPDYNILLEIDGTYWHSKGKKDEDIKSERLKEQRQNDKLKDKLAQDNGYTLIRIWSDEMFKLEDYCSKELSILDKI